MSLGYTAGYGAAGAVAGLETFLARRLKEQQMAELVRRNREQESIERSRVGEISKDRLARLAELQDTEKSRERDRQTQLGIAQMNANTQLMRAGDLAKAQILANTAQGRRLDLLEQNMGNRKDYQGDILDIRKANLDLQTRIADLGYQAQKAEAQKYGAGIGQQETQPDLLTRAKRVLFGYAPPTQTTPPPFLAPTASHTQSATPLDPYQLYLQRHAR